MPPSSVLSTRYRTARRYPVISGGPTTPCHDVALLLARCSASASAGAAVKWCQFDVESVHARYYAARCAARQGIRVRRWYKPGIVSVDSRATLSRSNRLLFVTSRVNIGTRNVILCFERKDHPYSAISLSSRPSSHPEHRSFSISTATERKQQNAVIRSRRPV